MKWRAARVGRAHCDFPRTLRWYRIISLSSARPFAERISEGLRNKAVLMGDVSGCRCLCWQTRKSASLATNWAENMGEKEWDAHYLWAKRRASNQSHHTSNTTIALRIRWGLASNDFINHLIHLQQKTSFLHSPTHDESDYMEKTSERLQHFGHHSNRGFQTGFWESWKKNCKK